MKTCKKLFKKNSFNYYYVFKPWLIAFIVYSYVWGLIFFLISVFTTLECFNITLRKNVYQKNITIILNKVSILNCKLLIMLFVVFLCLMMYPWYLNLFYRNIECSHLVENANQNCIDIIIYLFCKNVGFVII